MGLGATNLTNRTFQRLINKTLPYSIVTVDDVDRLPSFTNKEETYNLREKEDVESIDEEVKLNDNDPVRYFVTYSLTNAESILRCI